MRQLTTETLRPYAAKVMLTVGDTADLRYFLPRLLEIACGAGFDWPDLEPQLGRLRYAHWTNWPGGEREAVRDVLAALWSHTLARNPDEPYEADSVLCAIGNAEEGLTPYLVAWTAALALPTAAAQLRHLLAEGCRANGPVRRLTNAFWAERDAQADQVVTWLSSPALRRSVTQAFDAARSEAELQTLADVVELL